MSQMTSGSAYGPWHRPGNKMILDNSVTVMSKGAVLPLLVGPFLVMAIAGAAAHETIDLDKANELVAAADSAVDRVRKAYDQGTEGQTLFSLGEVLIEATNFLNRDMAAHSGQLTLNGQLLLNGFVQRNLAPRFDEALNRYLLPKQQLQEAIRLAPAASYTPRARFALLKASFYESFAFDPFKPLHADVSALQRESSEAETLARLLGHPNERGR